MTYSVFGGTLNLAQSISQSCWSVLNIAVWLQAVMTLMIPASPLVHHQVWTVMLRQSHQLVCHRGWVNKVLRPTRYITGHFWDHSFQAVNCTDTNNQKQRKKCSDTQEILNSKCTAQQPWASCSHPIFVDDADPRVRQHSSYHPPAELCEWLSIPCGCCTWLEFLSTQFSVYVIASCLLSASKDTPVRCIISLLTCNVIL